MTYCRPGQSAVLQSVPPSLVNLPKTSCPSTGCAPASCAGTMIGVRRFGSPPSVDHENCEHGELGGATAQARITPPLGPSPAPASRSSSASVTALTMSGASPRLVMPLNGMSVGTCDRATVLLTSNF